MIELNGWVRCDCGSRVDFESKGEDTVQIQCPECGAHIDIVINPEPGL